MAAVEFRAQRVGLHKRAQIGDPHLEEGHFLASYHEIDYRVSAVQACEEGVVVEEAPIKWVTFAQVSCS